MNVLLNISERMIPDIIYFFRHRHKNRQRHFSAFDTFYTYDRNNIILTVLWYLFHFPPDKVENCKIKVKIVHVI